MDDHEVWNYSQNKQEKKNYKNKKRVSYSQHNWPQMTWHLTLGLKNLS